VLYQERVAMFVPVFTPIWGVLAVLRGRKAMMDEVLWGNGKGKGKTE